MLAHFYTALKNSTIKTFLRFVLGMTKIQQALKFFKIELLTIDWFYLVNN